MNCLVILSDHVYDQIEQVTSYTYIHIRLFGYLDSLSKKKKRKPKKTICSIYHPLARLYYKSFVEQISK